MDHLTTREDRLRVALVLTALGVLLAIAFVATPLAFRDRVVRGDRFAAELLRANAESPTPRVRP